MRIVIHDWPDAPAKEIMAGPRSLTHNSAAVPNSQLVLFDLVVPYACATPGCTLSSPCDHPSMLRVRYHCMRDHGSEPAKPRCGWTGRSVTYGRSNDIEGTT
ncbi:hypothetical protein B0H16DRAFT_1366148 [Mycena metata]|uniref:Uncharacterized protein n=1 Tax=Mycena metata TaxID=1033252 RepID=A0AAD7JQV4_9AGAR|nr:hypothetical protein B0H16DRAFT_1366148 [Mycena metata]